MGNQFSEYLNFDSVYFNDSKIDRFDSSTYSRIMPYVERGLKSDQITMCRIFRLLEETKHPSKT